MSRSARLLFAVLILLAVPTTAHAATPFTAGSGNEPTVAVGPDGTGHVVWNATVGGADQVGYCRVAAGAEACNRSATLTFPGAAPQETGRPRVFVPAPNKVVVVAGCWQCEDPNNRIKRWISTDNGQTFSGPVEIGIGFTVNGFGTWLDDVSGGTFVAVNASSLRAFASLPPVGTTVPFVSPGYSYWPEVTRVHGTAKLVAASNNLTAVQYAVLPGPFTTPLDINTPGAWLKERPLPAPEAKNSDTALNSGPSGTYLTYRSSFPGESRIGLRRFEAATNSFGGANYVEGSNAIDTSADQPDSTQDASGRIHVAWRSTHGGGRLRYTVSDTAGANFSPAANLAAGENFTDPELGAAPDGRGFATWTQGTNGPVRVVPLDPKPESADGDPGAGDVPAIGNPRIDRRTLRPGQGTTFRFDASKAGLAVLTFEKRFAKGLKIKRKAKGKKAKTTCVPATKKRLRALRRQAKTAKQFRKLRRKRACKGWQRVGRIRQRVQPGANSIPFNGRIAGRKLTKGQYRGRLTITDAAGLVSRAETIKFKVVAKKAKKKQKRQTRRL